MIKIVTLLFAVIASVTAMTQVAINVDNSDPDGSAMLDIKSQDKGILIPRVTLNDASSAFPVTNPADGLIIYNIGSNLTKGLYIWIGSKWQPVGGAMYGNPEIEALGNGTATTLYLCPGNSLSFSSKDNGSWAGSTPTYSWDGPDFKSSEADPGEITPNFNPDIHAGIYTLTITNGIAMGCSYSSTITVVEVSASPSAPGTITGNTSVCENAKGENYSIVAVPNTSSYNWTVPADASITDGEGTTSITVDFGSTTDNVSVCAVNGCGNSAYNDLLVTVTILPVITVQPDDVSFYENILGSFSLTAIGADSYQWQENQGGGFTNITDGGVYDGANTAILTIIDGTGMDTYTYRCIVTNACDADTSDIATLHWFNYSLVISNGNYWMNRNLGADQQAAASDDYLAYGSLFQWGRADEGHEVINWTSSNGSDGAEQDNETTTNAFTETPNLGNNWDGKFILEDGFPYDWLIPQNNNLWQGVTGINNPCPDDLRLPTESEFFADLSSWSSQNSAGAYSSPLKLTVGGWRDHSTGALTEAGNYGTYVTSTIDVKNARYLNFLNNAAGMASGYRAKGFSVRCIKD